MLQPAQPPEAPTAPASTAPPAPRAQQAVQRARSLEVRRATRKSLANSTRKPETAPRLANR
eukprot:3230794-Alexandrium_andersonii.AAC.1